MNSPATHERRSGENVTALIPARGGSKSVTRKNIANLAGKPLIAWTIEAALKSRRIHRVIVTTDDPEIAEIARAYGAEVPFLRPAAISKDDSLDVEYHVHALDWLQENERYEPSMLVNLRPTAPGRMPEIIDSAIATFAGRTDVDSLRSVHLAAQSPYKMWTIGSDGMLEQVASLAGVREPYNQPRQALPLVYWQDGYIDIVRPAVIRDLGSTTGRRILAFVVDQPAIDIDYMDDLKRAEDQIRGAFVPHSSARHPS